MNFKINNDKTKLILKDSTKEEFNQLKMYLNRYVKNYRFMPRYKLGVWDGKMDYFNNGIIDFGLWFEVMKCCKDYGYQFNIENKDSFPKDDNIKKEDIISFCEGFYVDHKLKDSDIPFFPYEHQIDSIYKIMKWKYGLIEVATAGGKSLIFSTLLFYYIKNINKDAKFLLIVPNINLVTQFYNDIMEYNLGFNNDNKNPLEIRIDEVMSQQPRKYFGEKEPNISIGTYQSLEKRNKKWLSQFDVVCVDECLHPCTNITMSDGTLRKIKDIKIGEKVMTINEKINKKEVKEVEYIYKNLSKSQMYEIEMENGNIVKITGNHKVKLENGNWKRVDELTENDNISDFNFYI
jgi:hypothetical protein